MKLLTYHGRGRFIVPGQFTLTQGGSHLVADHLAEVLVSANPKEPLTITDPPEQGGSQPEAHQGEGQPTATEPQED